MMGGEITVQSEPGVGSIFCARIPMLLTDQPPVQAEETTVTGLKCIVVGAATGIADDLAQYLVHAGAIVMRAPDLAAARAEAAAEVPSQFVWIIDADQRVPTREELRAAIGDRANADDRFLVIGRGHRRRPRAESQDLVTIDGNAMTRRTFINAVALSAGRVDLDATIIHHGKAESDFRPPERLQAAQTGRLILVAEDNETNQQVIQRQLALLGFAADLVGDGREAFERWESGGYALLLTDLHMPRMDGYDLARAIRMGERDRPRIPIIALTANAMRGEADRCRAAGMDEYLSKPAPLSSLKAVLEKWLPAAGDTHPRELVAAAAAARSDVPIEPGILAGLVGDDSLAMKRIMDVFRASLPVSVIELRAACSAGNVERARAMAHKLKSSTRSIGALRLGNICAEIEKASRSGDVVGLKELVPRLDAEVAAVDAQLATG